MFYGAHLTRLSNLLHPNATPFPFSGPTTNMDPYGFWDAAHPSRLTLPADAPAGPYWLGVDFTTLGSGAPYLGPTNADVGIEIVKNWSGDEGSDPHLFSDVAYRRFTNGNGTKAAGNSETWLIPGLAPLDILEVVLAGGVGGLLVESNPSDGEPGGFATDSGPGTMSPHFYIVFAGQLP